MYYGLRPIVFLFKSYAFILRDAFFEPVVLFFMQIYGRFINVRM